MLAAFLIAFSALTWGQKIKVDKDSRMFTDSQGRSVLFHGVNVVVKASPFIPNTTVFDPQYSLSSEDIQNLQNWGFNFVRLGVMWEAVETAPGVYNDTYLAQINTLITNLGNSGIYTLVDNHQDAYARTICGEGVPNFYAANLTDSCDGILGPILQLAGACNPFSALHYNITDGVPDLKDCLSKDFWFYYSTPEAADGFQRIYENKYNYTLAFERFWDHVATYLGGNPYVVGYDIINEPLAANMFTQPWTAIPGVNDYINLQRLYKKVVGTIRNSDNDTVIFFEPIQGDVLPALGGMVFPMGFTDTPGGAEYNDRQVLNDHSYCCQSNAKICQGGEPPLSAAKECAAFNYARVTSRAVDAQNLGVGLMITEFGACLNSTSCVSEITSVGDACDANLVGWAYWMFKGYGDFTTSGNLQEGFYNNQSLQDGKVKALARTYVRRYQGVPFEIVFDPSNGHFTAGFNYDPNVQGPSELFTSIQYYYPNGLNISITPVEAGCTASVMPSNSNYYAVTCTSKTAMAVTIEVTAN